MRQAVLINDKKTFREYRKKAFESGKLALRNAKKYAFNRAEILKLIGSFYWLIRKKKKAIRSWNLALEEAQRLGSRVQFARVHLEICQRYCEAKTRGLRVGSTDSFKELDEVKTVFEEAGLADDLRELDILSNS